MRRMLGCLASLILISATPPETALAAGVFVGIGGVLADVDFDNANRASPDDSFGPEFAVGYRFDSKLVIEGGGYFGLSIDTFFLGLLGDPFSLSEQHVMAGYAFQPAERFSIVPKLGVSFWDIETDDGGFDESGSDLMFRLSAEWHVAERWRLYGAYTEAHYDFGDLSYPSFGFKFQF